MFIHLVLFAVQPKEVVKYRKDSLMWAKVACRQKGFLGYYTFRRLRHKGQYVSLYQWKAKVCHQRFMDRYHEWLVSCSRAKVKVLGYYNLQALDKVTHA
jgi:hypothetical protein